LRTAPSGLPLAVCPFRHRVSGLADRLLKLTLGVKVKKIRLPKHQPLTHSNLSSNRFLFFFCQNLELFTRLQDNTINYLCARCWSFDRSLISPMKTEKSVQGFLNGRDYLSSFPVLRFSRFKRQSLKKDKISGLIFISLMQSN